MHDYFLDKISEPDMVVPAEKQVPSGSVFTVSFTGHRPDKLGTGYSITGERVQAYSDMLRAEIVKLIEQRGAKRFISGGALGIDQIAFWTVHKLQQEGYDVENVLAVPFKLQYSNWHNKELVTWYHAMVKRADEVVYVDTIDKYATNAPVDIYTPLKMQKRNEYMVDYSHVVIACWDGTSGGTGNCVRYVREQNKELIQVMPISVW